ncbi:MAG: MFS transporter, partial [Methylotenera sp.]
VAGFKSLALFVASFCVIASMYGGGFATIPAYLADMFGTQFVGAIHGRLLTAWSTAGVLGPVVVNYLHDTRLEAGVPFDQIYAPIFLTLAGLLVVGFIANFLVKPVADKYYMTDAELELEHQLAHEQSIANGGVGKAAAASKSGSHPVLAVFAWALVLIPISYGVWSTIQKAWILFH